MEHTNGSSEHGILVVGIEAENFRRLKAARAKMIPGAGLQRITGKNGAGKTSLLSGIAEVMGGAGEVLPSAVHEGEEAGFFRIQLSNGFTVERRYTEANPKGYLTVVGPDGGKHGQTKLNEWLGATSFDPLAFFSLKPDRQREILLGLGDDPELPQKLEDLREERSRKYAERTPWISQKRKAGQVEKPEGERPDPIDVSAEMSRMGELQRQERERQDAFREAEEIGRQARTYIGAIEKADAEVERLRKELAEAEAHAKEMRRQGEATGKAEAEALKKAEALPDPSEEMEEVQARISRADEIRERLEPWKAYDRAREEREEATAAVDALTAEMEQLVQKEAELIQSAGIPVEGLAFTDEGEPLLNGRPLEVASGAERIRMAVAVALAANPELRVCLIDEANDVDLEGLEELDRLAKEHGFQLWACRLGLEGAGEIVIEDGVARDRDAEPEDEDLPDVTANDLEDEPELAL